MTPATLARLIVILLLLLPPFLPARAAWAGKNASPLLLATVHKHPPGGKSAASPNSPAPPRPETVAVPDRGAEPPAAAEIRAVDRGPLPKISARSAIIIDADTGEVIFARDPDRPAQPASTIKVLTGLLAIETLKKNDLVPVSNRAASMPRSKIYLNQGRSYPATDLIDAVLLASANDASVALAEKIAGSEWAFAQRMTRRATDLGASRTVCKTANGLTAAGQQSTARDLAVIFKQAMQNREFAARIKRTTATTSFGTSLRNHNRALWQISGSEGGKTGYTAAARQTYVGKFKRRDREIVLALMGSGAMWDDIKRLVEYGFASPRATMVRSRPQPPAGNAAGPERGAGPTILTDTKKTAIASL